MGGVITRKDVLLHPLLIISGWGATCYLRCLRAAFSRRASTFLSVVSR